MNSFTDRTSTTAAAGHASPLSVHALTEFEFCPRAGIVAVENDWQQEPERDRINLGFYLPVDFADLEHRLNDSMNHLWRWVACVVVALVAAIVASLWHRPLIALLGVLACIPSSFPLRSSIETVLRLVGQRRELLAWQSRELRFDAETPHPVDWRDILRSSWMTIRCLEAYQDDQRGLIGKPWCVIRHGSFTIPVWRFPPHPVAEPQIYPQHLVRMAAYCHLVTECEGRQSPCGVVLFGDSYLGTTLPFHSVAQQQLWEAYENARAILANIDADDRWKPPAPSANLCSGCPCGAPRAYRELHTEFRRNGEYIPVYGSTAADQKLYHSPCGDRFEWKPPHERAKSLGIV